MQGVRLTADAGVFSMLIYLPCLSTAEWAVPVTSYPMYSTQCDGELQHNYSTCYPVHPILNSLYTGTALLHYQLHHYYTPSPPSPPFVFTPCA